MSYQFDRLRLADRFRREALNELGDNRVAFEIAVTPDGNYAALRNRLHDQAQGLKATAGPNHWKTALYKALAQSAAFWSGGFRKIG